MSRQEIPIAPLEITLNGKAGVHTKTILENEIKDIEVEYVVITTANVLTDVVAEDCKTIYLFTEGAGSAMVDNESYALTSETILLPGTAPKVTITTAGNAPLHYLKISCRLTAQDRSDLKEFPTENTENVYYARFKDCQSYTEAIKSPNTVSRTILPNKYIPRVAMGTVQTTGPDKVGAHEHPMLEQLFLGLSNNNCTVYADAAKAAFSENELLHIPLGSNHSVAVEKGEVMYYVWMDFFLNREGEAWLETHKIEEG